MIIWKFYFVEASRLDHQKMKGRIIFLTFWSTFVSIS